MIEAFEVGQVYPMQMLLLHGYSERKTLDMTVDEFCEAVRRPQVPPGWDNYAFGDAAYK